MFRERHQKLCKGSVYTSLSIKTPALQVSVFQWCTLKYCTGCKKGSFCHLSCSVFRDSGSCLNMGGDFTTQSSRAKATKLSSLCNYAYSNAPYFLYHPKPPPTCSSIHLLLPRVSPWYLTISDSPKFPIASLTSRKHPGLGGWPHSPPPHSGTS